MEVGSDELSNGYLCDPCKREDDEECAISFCTECDEYLCDSCTKAHRRSKSSKHHHLIDDPDSMPKQMFSSMKSMCSKHKGKLVEFYCEIHDDCCCSDCASTVHKKCKKESIDECGTSEEYQSLMTTITDHTQQLQNAKTNALKKKDDVGHIHTTFVSEVKTFRSEINKILDSLEQNTLMEADTVRDKDTTSTESVSTTCDLMTVDLQEMSRNMETHKKYKQQRQIVITAKRAKTQIKGYKKIIAELKHKSTIYDYTFRTNDTILQNLKAVKSLGQMKEMKEKKKRKRKPKH